MQRLCKKFDVDGCPFLLKVNVVPDAPFTEEQNEIGSLEESVLLHI